MLCWQSKLGSIQLKHTLLKLKQIKLIINMVNEFISASCTGLLINNILSIQKKWLNMFLILINIPIFIETKYIYRNKKRT